MTNYLAANNVQQVSITILAGNTTATASITTGAGAFISWQGATVSDATDNTDTDARIEITNTSTITATRGASGTAQTVTINATIVDGDPTNLVKSVQSGTISFTTLQTSNTGSISAVTNTNTAIVSLGFSNTTSSASLTRSYAITSLATTTVTIARNNSGNAGVYGYCVVEFQGTALNSSTQNIAYSASKSGASDTSTITSSATANTWLAYGGWLGNSTANEAQVQAYFQLTAATTITYTWNTSSLQARKFNSVVVEFIAGVLAQGVQRGTIALAAATSNTATITSSTVNQTMVNWLNNSSAATTFNPQTSDFNITQTNPTTLTMAANTNATGTGSFECLQYTTTGGTTYDNSITETATSSDSETTTATGIGTTTETGTATDSHVGTATDSLSLTETDTASDSLVGGAAYSNSITESGTATDAVNGLSTLNDGTTETIVSSDSQSGTQTANATDTETAAANDNYDSSQVTPGTTTAAPSTGSGDDPWKRYILWLERKKKKQVKQKVNREGLTEFKATQLVDKALTVVTLKAPEIKKQLAPLLASIEKSERHLEEKVITQRFILAAYERIWQDMINQELGRRKQLEEDEETFFMMM